MELLGFCTIVGSPSRLREKLNNHLHVYYVRLTSTSIPFSCLATLSLAFRRASFNFPTVLARAHFIQPPGCSAPGPDPAAASASAA